MSTVDLFVLLSACLAIYGIFKYHQAEKSDYAATVQAFKDLKTDYESLKRYAEKEIKAQDVDLTTHSAQLKDLQKQIDDVQEHLAKLRASYMKLRDRVVSKPRKVEVIGAIPVEVMHPSPKPQLKKIKKQIDQLSK